MNALGRSVARWLLLVFLLLFWETGCATHKIDWTTRVGIYTYDQAVIEMGPPDKWAKLEDNTIVADWLSHRGQYMLYPNYNDPWYGPPVQTYHTYKTPDYYLRLTFGPDGKLRSWKKFAR